MMKNRIKAKMSSVYWLGGSTCAGKTTIANILSENYGFTVYHCDEYLGTHMIENKIIFKKMLRKLLRILI